MKDWDYIKDYVNKKGNKLDKLRLRVALEEDFHKREAVNILSYYQFSDGSWDYKSSQEDQNRIGSLGGTIHCLRWIREFNLEKNKLINLTLNFLSENQSLDGSFYEIEKKLLHSPQAWLQKKPLIDRFYFTAAVPMRLFSLGNPNHSSIEPAINWISDNHEKWEDLAGTWYGVWATLCLFSFNVNLPQSLFEKCYSYTLKSLSFVYPQPLTWLLDALYGAKFSREDPLIEKGTQLLKKLQNKQGFWNDSKYSTIETTITAIRILKIYSN